MSQVPITVACLCFGGIIAFLLAANMTSAKGEESAQMNTSGMTRDQLVVQAAKLNDENIRLQEETMDLRLKSEQSLNNSVADKQLQTQIDEMRLLAGTTALKGQGISITIDDTKNNSNPTDPNMILMIVHNADLYTIVNELKSSGAEAIEINGQRIGINTAITCSGPIIQINNTPVAPPFVINVIGDQDALYGGMSFPTGTLAVFRELGIDVKIDKKNEVKVSALKVKPKYRYAEVVVEKEDDTLKGGK